MLTGWRQKLLEILSKPGSSQVYSRFNLGANPSCLHEDVLNWDFYPLKTCMEGWQEKEEFTIIIHHKVGSWWARKGHIWISTLLWCFSNCKLAVQSKVGLQRLTQLGYSNVYLWSVWCWYSFYNNIMLLFCMIWCERVQTLYFKNHTATSPTRIFFTII